MGVKGDDPAIASGQGLPKRPQRAPDLTTLIDDAHCGDGCGYWDNFSELKSTR